MRRFYGFSVALLFGGMTALSFVAVPMLFAFLNNPALAGGLAAKYFALQHMFAVGLAVLVWLLLRKQLAKGVQRAWGGLALAAATSLWLVSPLIVSARATGGNLPLWHGIELVRACWFGNITSDILVHIGYFLVMIAAGLFVTSRRLRALFLR